jgi:hypothetical protein
VRLDPKIIARVRELSTQVDMRQIVHRLNVEGHRTRDDRPWSRAQVERVLKLIPQSSERARTVAARTAGEL